MIIDSITKVLQIVLGEAQTTNPCKVVTSWAETSTAIFYGGNTNTNTNGTTPVTVVSAPSVDGVFRDIREVRLFNSDTVAHTVTLQIFDGTNTWPVAPTGASVPPNGAFVYTPGAGIVVTDAGSTGVTVTDGSTTINGVTSLTFNGPAVSGASPGAVVTLIPRGYIEGLNLTVPSTTTLTAAAGQATSDDNTTVMNLASALTKSSAGTWVAGNNQNGLDTGTIANDTWYHVFVIYNPTTKATDVLFSTSPTTPALPSGFTKQRRIGSLLTDGSAHFIGFVQNGNYFWWLSPVSNISATVLGSTAAALVASTVPSGVQVQAILSGLIADASAASSALYISGPSLTNVAAVAGGAATATTDTANGTNGAFANIQALTNTSGQIRIRVSTVTVEVWLNTVGWIDPRGVS